jgi:hypothetical protein
MGLPVEGTVELAFLAPVRLCPFLFQKIKMKTKSSSIKTAIAALFASTAVTALAGDGSCDTLLNLLQKKGLLSEAEVKTLREEQAANTGVSAIATNAPISSSIIKLSGDFRGRFEGLYADDPSFADRNRLRFRLRAGAIINPNDKFEFGFRLTSGEAANGTPGGNPNSGNVTLQDDASKKLAFIDLAYGKWREVQNDEWSAVFTVGKMESPFVLSDMILDYDYTPEGLAQQLTWKATPNQTLSLNLGAFVLDGAGLIRRDSFLFGSQARLDSKWENHWQTSGGVAGLVITRPDELINANVPNQNRGNTRPGASEFGPGALAAKFTPIVADASVTYWQDSFPVYPGPFPIKLGGEYMHNFGADTRNQAYSISLCFGKAGKKGQWDLTYRWKYLEGDAWYEELVDDDFGAFYETAPDAGGSAGFCGGTNVRGHIVKANYSITDSFTIGATVFFTDLIHPSPAGSDSAFTRLQVDAIWKF